MPQYSVPSLAGSRQNNGWSKHGKTPIDNRSNASLIHGLRDSNVGNHCTFSGKDITTRSTVFVAGERTSNDNTRPLHRPTRRGWNQNQARGRYGKPVAVPATRSTAKGAPSRMGGSFPLNSRAEAISRWNNLDLPALEAARNVEARQARLARQAAGIPVVIKMPQYEISEHFRQTTVVQSGAQSRIPKSTKACVIPAVANETEAISVENRSASACSKQHAQCSSTSPPGKMAINWELKGNNQPSKVETKVLAPHLRVLLGAPVGAGAKTTELTSNGDQAAGEVLLTEKLTIAAASVHPASSIPTIVPSGERTAPRNKSQVHAASNSLPPHLRVLLERPTIAASSSVNLQKGDNHVSPMAAAVDLMVSHPWCCKSIKELKSNDDQAVNEASRGAPSVMASLFPGVIEHTTPAKQFQPPPVSPQEGPEGGHRFSGNKVQQATRIFRTSHMTSTRGNHSRDIQEVQGKLLSLIVQRAGPGALNKYGLTMATLHDLAVPTTMSKAPTHTGSKGPLKGCNVNTMSDVSKVNGQAVTTAVTN
jgi:hypothetical protein